MLILFNRIRNDFRVSVAAGTTLRADRYEAQFKALLEAHYRRVQKAFQGTTGLEIENEDIILAALILWAVQTANDSTPYVIATTQDNMDQALRNARQALADDGITQYSSRELAAVVATMLTRTFPVRASVIAVLETNRCAESTRLIEAYDAAGLDPTALVIGNDNQPVDMYKDWETVGDDRVRPAHRGANGQRKPVNKPFIVGGEKLMYPGDTTLGAGMANVANCRCSVIYHK